jgi:hypothetical protein
MRKTILGALVVAVVLFAEDRGRAQVDKAAYGTLFVAGTFAHTVTLMRNGQLLGTLSFPKGTELSAVNDFRHPPKHTGGGRFEFHGEGFELRALTAQDLAAQHPQRGTPGQEIMSHAPLVLTAQGVDVVLEQMSEDKD